MRISRIIVTVDAVLFAVVGLGFWVAPMQLAQRFHVEANGLLGLTALRAELGGLFVALSALCLVGLWTRHRTFLSAAVLLIGAIVAGRLIALVAHGWATASPSMLLIETQTIVMLLLSARSGSTTEPLRNAFPRRRAIVIGAIALLTLGTAGTVLLIPGVEQWLFERGATKAMASVNSAPLTDDAMRVAICGSSAPLASAGRAKACVAVFAGGKIYVVDIGPESVKNLLSWNVPLSEIGALFLTHFHSDHIGDLGELNLQTWVQGRGEPMRVYGGTGVVEVVDGFKQAYRLDQGYRTAHHTAQLLSPDRWPMAPMEIEFASAPTIERNRTTTVLDENGLRVTAIEVDHTPVTPALAYRFDYKGRSVVITGDTKYHLPLITAAQGADILVSEAIARPMVRALQHGAELAGRTRVASIMHDIQDYHVSPQEAAELANQANVKLLVFYHLLPDPGGVLTSRAFARGMRSIRRGDWVLSEDGSLYTLPIGTTSVRIGRVGS